MAHITNSCECPASYWPEHNPGEEVGHVWTSASQIKESEFGEDKVDTRKRGTELGPQKEHTAPSLVEGDGESFTDSFSSKL